MLVSKVKLKLLQGSSEILRLQPEKRRRILKNQRELIVFLKTGYCHPGSRGHEWGEKIVKEKIKYSLKINFEIEKE